MSDSFYSDRFCKKVWLTNHAIEMMAKRKITLSDVNVLIEKGEYKNKNTNQGWIYYNFPEREDNLVCAAIINEKTVIIKTIMIRWQEVA